MCKRNRPCLFNTIGCKVKTAKFNIAGSDIGIVCYNHIHFMKDPHLYVNVYSPCEYPGGCKTTGSLQNSLCIKYPGKYCSKHAKMIKKETGITLYYPHQNYCQEPGCEYLASFRYEGDSCFSFCSIHKCDGMINEMAAKCPECKKIGEDVCASYGFPGVSGRFCVKHKLPEMIQLCKKKCLQSGCKIEAGFGYKDGSPLFCKGHIPAGALMINLLKAHCNHTDCDHEPSFNFYGLPALCCSDHKEVGMINVKNRKCETCIEIYNSDPTHEYHMIHASFGLPGDTYRFCFKHKTDEMINLFNKHCEYHGCTRQPMYAYVGESPRFCIFHKEENMIIIYRKKCLDCDNYAYYGMEGNTAEYCADHHKEGMIYITYKKVCEKCNKHYAIYGKKEEGKKFCLICKDDDMINLSSNLCKVDECTEDAIYGFLGHYATRCRKHIEDNMIIKPRTRCVNCNEFAIWGYDGAAPIHCEKHHHSDEVNLIEKKCDSCGLNEILNKDNKCSNCDPAIKKTTYLVKQKEIMDYLDKRGLTGSSTDKMIDGGICTRRKPDRVFTAPNGSIIIFECDEHQHRDRTCECEQSRMVEICQNYGGTPVYFIRWNPDRYYPGNNDIQLPVHKRRETAADLIESIMNGNYELPSDALLSAIYLYYDGWTSIYDEVWRPILLFEKE